MPKYRVEGTITVILSFDEEIEAADESEAMRDIYDNCEYELLDNNLTATEIKED